MPRSAREISENLTYHIMLRGINQQQIFEEEEDYIKFLEILKHYQAVPEQQKCSEVFFLKLIYCIVFVLCVALCFVFFNKKIERQTKLRILSGCLGLVFLARLLIEIFWKETNYLYVIGNIILIILFGPIPECLGKLKNKLKYQVQKTKKIQEKPITEQYCDRHE